MDQVLKEIAEKKPAEKQISQKKKDLMERKLKRKKEWYKIGKWILKGNHVKLHKESQVAARRTYWLYSKTKGNWEGPSARSLGKMSKKDFEKLLDERHGEEEITLENVIRYINEDSQEIDNWLNQFEDDQQGDHISGGRILSRD
jgi:hypothetical protein